MNKEKVNQLFEKYERDFDNLDLESIAQVYSDNFISAGPRGTITQSKKEFEKLAGQARDMYKSLGQNSARILSSKIIPISNEYCMVTVHWGVTFEKTGDRPIEFDVSYIVQETEAEPRIILFISHQDEEKAMKDLGLQPDFAKT